MIVSQIQTKFCKLNVSQQASKVETNVTSMSVGWVEDHIIDGKVIAQ
jgi:hypothetical protein